MQPLYCMSELCTHPMLCINYGRLDMLVTFNLFTLVFYFLLILLYTIITVISDDHHVCFFSLHLYHLCQPVACYIPRIGPNPALLYYIVITSF